MPQGLDPDLPGAKNFQGLRRTGSTMVAIGAAGLVLLIAIATIRLARGELDPSLAWWLLPLALWSLFTAVAMTNTFTRSPGTTTVTTLGRKVRTIRDEDVISIRLNRRRFEVSAGGREVCSVLTGYGIAPSAVLESYQDLILERPALVAEDKVLRRWAWEISQR